MKNSIIKIIAALFLSVSFIFGQSEQKFAEIGDLKLLSENIIKNCIIGYRTFGNLNEDSSNVIIYPTWFGGTTEGIETLIKKYSFIDSSKYFIIAIDALGNGISSSPSNYDSMRNGLFPQITIRDMVNSQYKLVTEIFKLKHLFAAIGGSMGSMQVLEWAVAYPDFIDKIIAYVATPKMSSFDLLWMNTQLTMIESSRRNGMSEKEIKKISDMMTAIIARTPAYTIENTRVQDIPSYIASFDKEPSKVFTLDNYVTLLKAMMKHDISLEYNESMEQAAKSIKAKLFIIVSETDMMVNPTEALRLIDLTNAKKLILQNNCGHLAVSCEIDKCREEIAKFLNN